MAVKLAEHDNLHSVQYGHTVISFRLNFAARRTLAIHVYPDTTVVVDAPKKSSLDKIKGKVLKRAGWIRRQQRLFERFPPALPARKYVSGESFQYLGRQHMLKVELGLINKVRLERGVLRVLVTRSDPNRVKELVDEWYRQRAAAIFSDRLEHCQKLATKARISYTKRIYLRTMRTRWGTCSKDSRITLNPELVSADKECIDYVIVHELCHLREHNHGRVFYDLLTSIMPDWERRKDKLDLNAERRLL